MSKQIKKTTKQSKRYLSDGNEHFTPSVLRFAQQSSSDNTNERLSALLSCLQGHFDSVLWLKQKRTKLFKSKLLEVYPRSLSLIFRNYFIKLRTIRRKMQISNFFPESKLQNKKIGKTFFQFSVALITHVPFEFVNRLNFLGRPF